MPDDATLPAELAEACQTLEIRLRMLRVRTRKVESREWDELPQTVRDLIPKWIIDLLANYAVAGGVLEYRDEKQVAYRFFRFFEPEEYIVLFEEVGLFRLLPGFGFFPFAVDQGDDVWLAKVEQGGNSEVNFLERSNWNGDCPTVRNGLTFASTRLSLLLACMGVSIESYGNQRVPSSVLWIKEHPKAG